MVVAEKPKKDDVIPPFTSQALAAWRERMGFSKVDACAALGCSREGYDRWENGESTPPRYIGLACAALALGIDTVPQES